MVSYPRQLPRTSKSFINPGEKRGLTSPGCNLLSLRAARAQNKLMFKSRGRNSISVRRNFVAARAVMLFALLSATAFAPRAFAQTQTPIRYDRHESERSDKLTGGRVERAEFAAGEPDIRLTLNVPSFRLTLWQNDREVKSYFVGVGMKDYPIYIGDREATEVIWNPVWIVPSSDWTRGRKGVKPGQVVKPTDPNNPLGKLKIPLGDGYLIHQAASTTDLGGLVSHGCVRMLRADLYDLAEKIVAARSAPVSRKQIQAAKLNKKTLVATLDEPLPVDINYDTLVVEGGALHIYPDVYERRQNTPERLRAELQSSGIDVSQLDEETMKEMLAKVTRRTRFVVEAASIEEGRALEDGRLLPLIGNPAKKPTPATRKRTVKKKA